MNSEIITLQDGEYGLACTPTHMYCHLYGTALHESENLGRFIYREN